MDTNGKNEVQIRFSNTHFSLFLKNYFLIVTRTLKNNLELLKTHMKLF